MPERPAPPAPEDVYLRQLLSGRDFAVGDPVASSMVNYAYALGDRRQAVAVLVDPAYAVAELVERVEADGMRLAGVLVTHHHADHVGGSLAGHRIEGLAALLELRNVPVHANRHEVDAIRRLTGAGGEVLGHDGGDTVTVGRLEVQLLHTPGHTPGSQCFLAEGMLISGDTLFLEGCGRTDLPGSDPDAMYHSLQRLAALPDATAVLPGHRYSASSRASMEAVRAVNSVFRPATREAWRAAFGG